MRIRHVELENFLSHETEVVSLPDHGVFFLDGPSGFGKSSFIVDAVLYALFGPRATRGSQEELKHLDYPDEPMRAKVVFEFQDGQQLAIERSLNERNKPQAVAYDEEGRLLAEGPRAVDGYVRRRLGGLSWQQLRAAFVCHQKEVAALTDLAPAERKKLVHRLLGIRELEVSQDEVKDRLSKAKQALIQVDKQVGSRTRAEEENALKDLERAHKEATKAREQAEAALEEAKTKLKSTSGELVPLREALTSHERIRELELNLEKSRIRLDDLEAKLTRHQTAEQLVAGQDKLLSELAREQDKLDALAAAGARAKAHGELVEKRLKAAERLTKAQAQVGEAGEPPEALEARLGSIKSERALLESDSEKRHHELHLLDEQGVCFTCSRPLPEGQERDELLAGLKGAADSLTSRLEALAAEAKAIEERLPGLRLQAQSRREAELELARAQEAVAQIDTQLKDLEDEGPIGDVSTLRDEYRRKQEVVKGLERREDELKKALKDIDPSLPAQVEALRGERSQEEAELEKARQAAKIPVDRDRFAALEADEARLKQQVASLEGQLPLRRDAETASERELKTAKTRFDELVRLLDEREARNLRLLRLESLADYIDSFTKHLATEIRPAIEEMATEMLYQMTNGRFVALSIDENYDISIQRESGNWIKPAAISGGEEVRANLCLRLALTRLVSQRTGVPVQFIVLDEPFGNLDPSLIDVSMGLLDSLRSFYPQIFIISHTGDLQSSQHVDYRLAFDTPSGRNRVKLYQR